MPGDTDTTSKQLYEDTPLTLMLNGDSRITAQQWEDSLEPITAGDRVAIAYGDTGGDPGFAIVGNATVGSNGELTDVQYTWGQRLFHFPSLTLTVLGGGTGGTVTPILTPFGNVDVFTGLTLTAAGSGYTPTPTTLSIRIGYRVWTP